MWVVDANLDAALVSASDAVFTMVDFLDFETQPSPLSAGASPVFNFAATFKVQQDTFLMKHFATESMAIDVCLVRHSCPPPPASFPSSFLSCYNALLWCCYLCVGLQARSGDYEVLGRAVVPLRELLHARSRVKLPSIPVRNARAVAIGTLNLEMRMALSVSYNDDICSSLLPFPSYSAA